MRYNGKVTKALLIIGLKECDTFIYKMNNLNKNENSVNDKNLSVSDYFSEMIEWLIVCYEKTSEENYLEVVERILWICNEISDTIFSAQLMKFDKADVRRILRRWPKSSEIEKSPEWVVDDIIFRVVNRVKGRKYYQRGRNIRAFELVVSEDKVFLMDLERRMVYVFR